MRLYRISAYSAYVGMYASGEVIQTPILSLNYSLIVVSVRATFSKKIKLQEIKLMYWAVVRCSS